MRLSIQTLLMLILLLFYKLSTIIYSLCRGVIYKNWGFYLEGVSDCEELVGYLMEHLGIDESNYFMYQWAGACLPPGEAD